MHRPWRLPTLMASYTPKPLSGGYDGDCIKAMWSEMLLEPTGARIVNMLWPDEFTALF